LNSVESLLGWDERTMLPAAGGDYRADQMTLLAGMLHRRRTDPRLGEWLSTLVAAKLDPRSDQGATVRELKRQYDRRVKLPQALVEELARTSVLGQQAWVHARAKNDFASFQPLLEKTFELKRKAAQAIGYKECAYDALLDEFEPGALTSQVTRVLSALREQLVPLVAEIGASGRQPKIEILARDYPVDRQEKFASEVAAKLGFEFNRGRLDVTAHPFCSSMGPHDCRITTRYDRHHFPGAFFGVLHEAGHGIYDQGLRPDWYGLPRYAGSCRPFWRGPQSGQQSIKVRAYSRCRALGWSAAVANSVSGWVTFLSGLAIVLFAIVGFRWLRSQLLWRLRNRLRKLWWNEGGERKALARPTGLYGLGSGTLDDTGHGWKPTRTLTP
jgi:Zn-dependent M32 family carboxypeptidase